jgi:hypothetical protein
MAIVSWNEVEKNRKIKKSIYFKISPGEKSKIRPLGNPVVFKRFMFKYNDIWRSAICLDEKDCPAMKNHNISPVVRCAINVLDRRDNSLKILEGAPKIFQVMKLFFEKTGKNPGGTDGAQYYISLNDTGGKSAYSLEFAGSHTLLDEDIALVKSNGLFLLKKIYKATPPDEIEKVLFGDIPGFQESKKLQYEGLPKVDVYDDFNF